MKKITSILIITFLFSCSNKPSLQKFMVENSEKKDFVALDLSSDFLNIPLEKLNEEEKKALKSFKKVNILAFKKNESNENIYQTEKNKLLEVMQDTTQYQEMMKLGNNKQSAALYTLGSSDSINEFVILGNKSDAGFGIIRILGENMNPEHAITLISLLQKANIDATQFKAFEEILKP